eukprot:6370640-Prymnesium_polylepis.1
MRSAKFRGDVAAAAARGTPSGGHHALCARGTSGRCGACGAAHVDDDYDDFASRTSVICV